MQTRKVRRSLRRGQTIALVAAGALLSGAAAGQFPDLKSEIECAGCGAAVENGDALAPFAGVWSTPAASQDDPAWEAEDFFCFVACTPRGREIVAGVLRDPANARRSAVELFPEAAAANAGDATKLLTPAAAVNAAPGANAGTTRFACNPDGLVPQVLSPLPLAIEGQAAHVVLRYEEFGVRRIASVGEPDHGTAGLSAFGTSSARIENGALVVRTTRIAPGRIYGAFGKLAHGPRASTVERYTVSGDGRWLELTLGLTDPDTLREPLVLVKRWRRAAEHETLRAHGCDALSAGLEGVVFEYLDPAKIDARRAQARAVTGLQPPPAGLASRFASVSTRGEPGSAASETLPATASTFTSAASDRVPSPTPLPFK